MSDPAPTAAEATSCVLVTGASGGIGMATVGALSRLGFEVFASMRDPTRADPEAFAPSRHDGPVHALALDVTDDGSITKAMEQVAAQTERPLRAVVHCAGAPGAGFFVDGPTELARSTMETNFLGVVAVTAAALPMLRAAGGGRVVVVSSVAAFSPMPALSAYAASKWALEGWCESLAVELAPIGIDFVLVEPGTYRTPIWEHQLPIPDGEPYHSWGEVLQKRATWIVAHAGRDPLEVGERIARLVAAERPRFRNPVGPDSWALRALRALLPFSARRRLLSLVLGAPRRAAPPA